MSRSTALRLAAAFALVSSVGSACRAGEPEFASSEPEIEITRRPEPPRPQDKRGWAWEQPPGWIRPQSLRRSHVFYVGERVVFKTGPAAAEYEVRDYWGNLVDRGKAGGEIAPNVSRPGWYKLYLFAAQPKPQWGDAIGDTTFVIFRNDPNFPPLPPPDVPGGSYPSEDQPMRGVLGMGPLRYAVQEPDRTDEFVKALGGNVELARKYYLPFDPVRRRALMCAFPNGTRGKLDGIRKIVSRFKDDIAYWEPRNEPNFGSGGADFVRNELKDFYETVKSVDGRLKVMGPGTVSVGPMLMPWIEDFFRAGGARYIDVFSFHIYNGVNGDIWLARWTMDALMSVLHKYGVGDIEKWQTEQGFFAAVYGAYQPRLQGRWTMLEMMVFEQYGIPKEHNHLWYDRSHGFWDFPTWWENDDGGLNPAAPLMRVFAEELYGTTFSRRLEFGKDGDKLYIGSLFESPDKKKRVAAIMNVGCGRGRVELAVKGGAKLRVVSPFGVESELAAERGRAALEVPELPVYVELAPGQEIEVIPQDWGRNLAREEGVRLASSGSGKGLGKIVNGHYENWYYRQQPGEEPWADDTGSFPAWVELQFPAPRKVSRVVLFSCPPWQNQSTLVQYELQADQGGRWATLARVKEPLKTFGVYSCVTRTKVDSFFADRWVFEHEFAPVTTGKIRLLVQEATWGGGATKIVGEAGGQTGEHRFMLRELEVYGPPPAATVRARAVSRYLGGRSAEAAVAVSCTDRSGRPGVVTARAKVPEGWRAEPAEARLSLPARGSASATLNIAPVGEIHAGALPVQVELLDSRGELLDADTATFEVFAPVDLEPAMPARLDSSNQELSVVATNVTKEKVEGELRLGARELVAEKGRTFEQRKRLSLAPYEPATVAFAVPGLDLAGSAWEVEYTFRSGRRVARAVRTFALRSWMALGPFANDFDREFGPEKGVDFTRSYAAQGGQVGWKEITSDMGGFVDLTKVFSPNQNVSAYIAAYVKSPGARKALLSAGSDDGIKLWLNGRLVVSNNVARAAVPGQEKVDVELREGWNEVLMKITQGVGGWGFYFDLLGPDGKAMTDLIYSTRK